MATYLETQARYVAYVEKHRLSNHSLVKEFTKYLASGNSVFLQEVMSEPDSFIELAELPVDNWNREAIQEVIIANMAQHPYMFFNKHYSVATTTQMEIFPVEPLRKFVATLLAKNVADISWIDGLINSNVIAQQQKEELILQYYTKYLGVVDETVFSKNTLKKLADVYIKGIQSQRSHRASMMLNPELTDKQFLVVLNYLLSKDGFADSIKVPDEKWHVLEKVMLQKKLTLHTALTTCGPSDRILSKYKILCIQYDIDNPSLLDYYHQECLNSRDTNHAFKFARKLINNLRDEKDFLDTYLLLQNLEKNHPILLPHKEELMRLLLNKLLCPSKLIALHGAHASANGLAILQKDATLQGIYMCAVIAKWFPYYDDQQKYTLIQANRYTFQEFGALPTHFAIDILKVKANQELFVIKQTYGFSDEDLTNFGVLIQGSFAVTSI